MQCAWIYGKYCIGVGIIGCGWRIGGGGGITWQIIWGNVSSYNILASDNAAKLVLLNLQIKLRNWPINHRPMHSCSVMNAHVQSNSDYPIHTRDLSKILWVGRGAHVLFLLPQLLHPCPVNHTIIFTIWDLAWGWGWTVPNQQFQLYCL